MMISNIENLDKKILVADMKEYNLDKFQKDNHFFEFRNLQEGGKELRILELQFGFMFQVKARYKIIKVGRKWHIIEKTYECEERK